MATSKLGKILDKIVPSDSNHYVEQRKLLWTNARPTSGFAPQTISLALSGYDFVGIVFNEYVNEDRGNGFTAYEIGKSNIVGNSSDGSIFRLFTTSNSGISFGRGTVGTIPTDYVYAPLKIYGIKKLGGVVRTLINNMRDTFFGMKLEGGIA